MRSAAILSLITLAGVLLAAIWPARG
jgi:hypothetical protein